jgi:NADPH:quinone reductase-like Zn-dependent oxidoreductase
MTLPGFFSGKQDRLWGITGKITQLKYSWRNLVKAIVNTKYGSPDVLRFEEIEKPTPRDNEVLIEVHAASVNAADWHVMRGTPYLSRLVSGLLKPKHKILGADVAGRVEVGKVVPVIDRR